MTHESSVVFVVDDDASVRRSLALLIESAGWQVKTFATAHEFLSFSAASCPSCLVLDLELPDVDGLELQERVAGRRGMPVIFVSGHGDVPTTVRAMKGGAMEFLTKPIASDTLLDAIHQALERSSASLAQAAALHSLRARHDSLTSREREVMALVVSGLLNKQIGARLGISEITVKAHRGSMVRKMSATSLAQLVNMAAMLGIAPDDSNAPFRFVASREGANGMTARAL
jgi:FixJ family two-component response regulator